MRLRFPKLVFIALIFLAVSTASFSLTSKAAAETDNVVVLSHTGYLDSYGNYYVVGEVQNVGSQTVNFVRVEATFFDSQNNVIDIRFDLTMLYTILPGRRSPFLIALLDVAQSAKVHHYSLTASFLTTQPIPIGLEIVSHNSQIDTYERMHITGEIKNIQIQIAHNIKIIATYYDTEGNVVAAAQTDLDPIENDLNPDETRPFEIVLSQERTAFVKRYELTAESLEYAVIPEFQKITPTLLLFAIFTLAIAFHKHMAHKKASKSASHLVIENFKNDIQAFSGK